MGRVTVDCRLEANGPEIVDLWSLRVPDRVQVLGKLMVYLGFVVAKGYFATHP